MSEQSAAKNRFIQFQQTQAVGVDTSPDLPQVLRTDQFIAEGAGGYKTVVLSKSYESDNSQDQSLGKCVRRALRSLINVDVTNLPAWIKFEDLGRVCDELGLQLIVEQQVLELNPGERIIIIYFTDEITAHAVVVSSESEVLKITEKIAAVIRVPN